MAHCVTNLYQANIFENKHTFSANNTQIRGAPKSRVLELKNKRFKNFVTVVVSTSIILVEIS